MAGAPQKVDVTLTVAAEHQEAAAALKSGQTVQLAAAPDGGVDCSSVNGAPLGRLPGGNCPPLVRGAFEGTIRSIRWAKPRKCYKIFVYRIHRKPPRRRCL